jgi:hypothetical protein
VNHNTKFKPLHCRSVSAAGKSSICIHSWRRKVSESAVASVGNYTKPLQTCIAARAPQQSAVRIPTMEPYDLVVIGAGMCGLIAARDALKLGAKVKVLEASGRVGGQVWGIDHVETKKPIALGAEWLHSSKHESMFNEFKRYQIHLDTFVHKREHILYGGKGEKAKVSEKAAFLAAIKVDSVYINAMRIINWDVLFICFKDGYFQPDSDQYDMPFIQYLAERLQVPATSPVHEFILMQVFNITGGNPVTQSALGVLYVIAGYRTAEKAFSVESELLHRYPSALSKYMKALADEVDALGGEIDFYTPVVEVRKEEIMLPIPRVPNYDYPPLPDRKRTVFIKCGSKQEIAARAVIVAVPLKCLATIRFDPPLPLELRQAAERCNAGVEQLKMYAFAAGISSDIGRLSTVQYECRESYTIARHHKYNASAAATGLSADGVLVAAAASAKIQSRRTLTVAYKGSKQPDEQSAVNRTLVCTNGSRHDLLHNLARNLRKIYPVIELQNDKAGNTPASSRPSTTASGAGTGRPRTGVNTTAHVSLLSVNMAGRSAVHSELQSPVQPQMLHPPAAEGEQMEAPEDINTSEYTVSHDGAVVYHDFLSDVCIRGTWFNLRAGTAHLHVLASRAARMPWHNNTRRSAYAASTSMVGTAHSPGRSGSSAAAARTFTGPAETANETDISDVHDDASGVEVCHGRLATNSSSMGSNATTPGNAPTASAMEELTLIIAGAELHPEWTGWLEGAVLSGALAARRVYPYLFPPMVPRNYAKRIGPQSPDRAAAPPVAVPTSPLLLPQSPKYSPSLDRRRGMSRPL